MRRRGWRPSPGCGWAGSWSWRKCCGNVAATAPTEAGRVLLGGGVLPHEPDDATAGPALRVCLVTVPPRERSSSSPVAPPPQQIAQLRAHVNCPFRGPDGGRCGWGLPEGSGGRGLEAVEEVVVLLIFHPDSNCLPWPEPATVRHGGVRRTRGPAICQGTVPMAAAHDGVLRREEVSHEQHFSDASPQGARCGRIECRFGWNCCCNSP